MGVFLTIMNIVTGLGSILGLVAFLIVFWYFGSKEGREYQIELDDLFDESDAPEERRPYFGCFGLYLRFPIRPAIRPARIIITRNGTESTSRSPCNMSAMRSPPPLSLCLSLNGKGGPLALFGFFC